MFFLAPETLARLEARLRPVLTRLPPLLAVQLYSLGRRRFIASFHRYLPPEPFDPRGLGRTLWGLELRSPIGNAAGMFKTGEGYALAATQGAGAYLAGTTTAWPRTGNRRAGVKLPFAPYPVSHAASNWLGLPNPGHQAVAEKLRGISRIKGCPVGASAAACPDRRRSEEEKLAELALGLRAYEEAGVDFLELNESCPNTPDDPRGFEELRARLDYLKESFLDRRARSLPVVVKFSCDTEVSQVPVLLDLLIALGFDGVNFGNTSTDYALHRQLIAGSEARLYDDFTSRFGGGLSGRPLARPSLRLCEVALRHLRQHPPGHEFHVIRTGGIENAADIAASETAGIAFNQWYTGYFEAFARFGHGVYRELYRQR